MASIPPSVKAEKPSFAKIAAAGIKPPIATQILSSTENINKHGITSSPQDGAILVSPSHSIPQPAFTPQHTNAIPLDLKETKAPTSLHNTSAPTSAPQVHVQNMDPPPIPGTASRALDGMPMLRPSDEASTQVSSSSGSAKLPSLDGKSIASGTTYALDEKESLRPDDSASVMANEDEDVFSPIGSGIPGSHTDSDDGVRAFRDQLREISGMEPSRRLDPPPNFAQTSNSAPGVLYVPPQHSGVGTVPGATRPSAANLNGELPPDSKLLEALESPKDRIMVLKLEQDIVDFVKDNKESSLKLPQTNAFYRMLAHRLADYYMLGHLVDESTQAVRIYKTQNCRIAPPLTGIATPSTAASTPPPTGAQMKILRRGVDNVAAAVANGSNMQSNTASENGESGTEDEKKPAVPFTREEREARYEAARKRIMGSARPSDSPEDLPQKETSRSSSVAGKKNRKKLRADSDDDFEARSAYSAYYTPTFNSNGTSAAPYSLPTYGGPTSNQSPASPFGNPDMNATGPSFASHGQGAWPSQQYPNPMAHSSWSPNQQTGYDLAGDFNRAMTFEQPAPAQALNTQAGYASGYNQSFYGQQQSWPQQSYSMATQPIQSGYGNAQSFPNRPPSSGQQHELQPYAYGQLPSQAFPGRPPNKLEHPLPGSYKSKHFNPQSQSFTPNHLGGMNPASPACQAQQLNSSGYVTGYAMPATPQRQTSSQSQASAYGSPQAAQPALGAIRMPSQPINHPLPQPVFPQQPTPNVALPPKPEVSPHNPSDGRSRMESVVSVGAITPSTAPNQSTIAKWGAPASLPRKPPPTADSFEAAKYIHSQHPTITVAAATVPVRKANGLPNFGSMPPVPSAFSATGQSTPSPRRP